VASSTAETAQSQQEGFSEANEEFENVLDQDIALIRRKSVLVKTENVGEVFMQNIGQISETVQGFQKMSEESFKNDAVLYFQQEKENYERQIEQLKQRVEKTQRQKQELEAVVTEL